MSEVRLIDAEALKEDFKSRLAKCNEWIEKAKDKETKIRASAVKSFIGEVIMTIDNAPTVKTYETFSYEKGFQDGEYCAEMKTPHNEWNNHTVACLLADLFGDPCACNHCGIDEWLPKKCDFANKECPDVVGVACWEQFLKHRKGGAE